MHPAIQTAAEKQNRNTLSVPALPHESYCGALRYELWITANRLFLPCLTYCGQGLMADGCLRLDSLPQCSTLYLPSLCYSLIITFERQGRQ